MDPRGKPDEDGGWGELCGKYSNGRRHKGGLARLFCPFCGEQLAPARQNTVEKTSVQPFFAERGTDIFGRVRVDEGDNANLVSDVQLQNVASVIKGLIAVRSPCYCACMDSFGKFLTRQAEIVSSCGFPKYGIKIGIGDLGCVNIRQNRNTMCSPSSQTIIHLMERVTQHRRIRLLDAKGSSPDVKDKGTQRAL